MGRPLRVRSSGCCTVPRKSGYLACARRCGVLGGHPAGHPVGMLREPMSRPGRRMALVVVVVSALLGALPPAGAAGEPGSEPTAFVPPTLDPANPSLGPSPDPTATGQTATGQTPTGQTAPAPAPTLRGGCRKGWVALTFDDGPDPEHTSRLVRILADLQVPATFFMVGQRVEAAPETTRLVARRGFQIANHSFRHQDMRTQTSRDVRATLRRTQRAFERAGVTPTRLMRPPYGSIDRRVERAIRGTGFVPVLWTVDSADWAGGTSRQIADRILARLHPQGTNVVLQHDGVTNSPASIGAVRRVVETARQRGYCFTGLTRNGTPNVPAPTAKVTTRAGREGTHASVTVRLSHAVPRATSLRLRTVAGTATADDYQVLTRTIRFGPGETEKVVQLAVTPDEVAEPAEEFAVELDRADGMVLGTQLAVVDIIDARQLPAVAVASAVVREPARHRWALAKVRVWLGRATGNDVVVTVRSIPGDGRRGSAGPADFTTRTRTLTIPAGATEGWVSFPVARDRQQEGRERFAVEILSADQARVARARAWVTILG